MGTRNPTINLKSTLLKVDCKISRPRRSADSFARKTIATYVVHKKRNANSSPRKYRTNLRPRYPPPTPRVNAMEESGETVEFVPERRPNLTTILEQYKLATEVMAALANVLETHHSFSKRLINVAKKYARFEGINENEEEDADDDE